ncbi:putative glycosyltransferase [Nymphaea thermarum]|nr:putative glycosyltransferase [Nymphaea thermarum]
MHGRVRPVLLKYWSDKDEDMKIYGPLPNRVSRQMSYVQHMKSSKFCICPMGYEVNSPRIVEAIYNECVPVIIADNFVLPFDDILNWSEFSVVVAEKDIPKLKDILMAIPLRRPGGDALCDGKFMVDGLMEVRSGPGVAGAKCRDP